jgi:TolB-like protein
MMHTPIVPRLLTTLTWLVAVSVALPLHAAPKAQPKATTQPAAATQAGPLKILVQRVEPVGVEADLARSLEESVVLNLGRRDGVQVVTSAELEQTVKFTGNAAKLGCTATDECLAEVQKKLAVGTIITGQLGRLGPEFVLTLSVLNANNGTVTRRVNLEDPSFDKLRAGVPGLLEQLLGAAAPKPAFQLPAGQTLKLAVLPLSPRGVPDATSDAMTQILAAELNSIKGVSVISQDDIKAILNKSSLEAKVGCTDNIECVVEIGSALGLSKLVAGSVGKVKDTWVISLQLIDTKKADVQNRVLESFAGDQDELKNAVKLAAYQVVGVDVAARPGAVDFSFNVKDADGALGDTKLKLKDSTFAAQALKPGRYPLRLIADPDTYLPLQTDIYVAPGATNVRSIEVIAKPTPWYKTWWFWTITGVVLAGAGGTTAYLLLNNTAPPPATGTVNVGAVP